MERMPIDIILWKTGQDNWKDDASSRNFEFYFQNVKVGKCSTRLCQHAYSLSGKHRFFPTTWFNPNSEYQGPMGAQASLKPFLEITNFDFSNFQAKGYGRMGLQKMYELSQNLGAQGRIFLIAKKKETSLRNPESFYEHCGFEGNEGTEGGKFFNPTPRHLKILFSKPLSPLFTLKEVPVKKNLFIDPRTGQFQIPTQWKTLFNTKSHE